MDSSGRTTTKAEEELCFLREFREAATVWTAFAAGAGALLYCAIMVVCLTLEEHQVVGLVVRAAVCAFLIVVALAFALRVEAWVKRYALVASLASALALGGTVTLVAIQRDTVSLSHFYAVPALMFGISVHYAFLRLPLPLAALIGWSVAVAAVLLMPQEAPRSELVRSAIYLAFSNIFGMVFSCLVERRERQLYNHRRRAELAEYAALERQASAEAANDQKTRLIAAVSHDLRQPMTAALSYLNVTRNRLWEHDLEGARSSAERAEAAVNVLGSTLDHLLTAARYESGTEAVEIGYVELTPVLRDVYGSCVGEAEHRDVRIDIRPPRERIVVSTDSRSMLRVLNNLVSNAIKYSTSHGGRKPRVLVISRWKRGHCRIEVIDNGIGIPAAQLSEIWKPFVQLNNVERDRERGLGLGLFLVQKIVQQLPGHSIQVRSVPGRGSRFTLTLPAAKLTGLPTVAVPESTASTPEVDLQPLSGAYVLVLEDDRDTRIAVVEMLEAWGLEVSAGATMAELMSAHADSDRLVDAIVCDYRLAAGTNGVDAIASLRERLGYAPHAVLVTGEPDIAPIRARAGPETTVLHKPFPPDSLARPLIRAVQATRLLEEG